MNEEKLIVPKIGDIKDVEVKEIVIKTGKNIQKNQR